MTIFKTWLNFQEEAPDLEQNDGQSQTEPDQTMSLHELLQQHSRGIQIPTFESGHWEDEDGFMVPNMKFLDLTEAMDLADQHLQSIEDALDHYGIDRENVRTGVILHKQPPTEGRQSSGEADKPPVSGGAGAPEGTPKNTEK